jgi:hypothetical protein
MSSNQPTNNPNELEYLTNIIAQILQQQEQQQDGRRDVNKASRDGGVDARNIPQNPLPPQLPLDQGGLNQLLAGYLQQTGSASVQGALAANYPLSRAAHPGLNVSHQLLESVQRVAAINPELAAAARQALSNPQPHQQEPLQGIQQQQAQPQVGRVPPGEAIPSVAAAQGAGNAGAGAGGELSYASVQDWALEQLGKVISVLKLYIISRDSNQHQRTFFTK